jgi:conjugative relaxase-like TrwC/TraI family protein
VQAESPSGVVTMSLHKLTAGSGYDYLTRQVAALDATEKGHTGLASYYTERGESPGVWIGSGMDGIDGLAAGDPVTAEQMRALFGCGLHPLAELRLQQLEGPDLTNQDFQNVARLGAPFKIVDNDLRPFRLEVARRIAALNTAIGWPADASIAAADRARVRTQVAREFFLAAHGREPIDARELAGQIAKDSRPRTQTVAGYDLTFSPVKSVSALWAVADPAVAAVIERAHQDAVKEALTFVEEHALFTRTGPQGIRQVNVRGLVAAAFTHRDSRAGDPDLHTHVAVANKVQTLDGRWLSIDGRVLFKANVAASETYNIALEQNLRDTLGVRFAERPGTDPTKRPIREIVGVDPRLNQRWSTRRAHINTRRGELAIQFQHDHGRPPTPVEGLHLAQQATLETRDAKHEPRSLAEQRATWRSEAAAVLGGPEAVASMMRTVLAPPAQTATIADSHWIAQTANRIVAVMEHSRSTWQMWHVRAEAQRHVRTIEVPAVHATALVDLLVDEVLDRRSVALAASADPVESRGRCGESTAPRSTPWPAPTFTLRSESWTLSCVSSPRRDVAAVLPPSRRRSTWACSKWRPTGLHSMLGRPPWSAKCAPPGPVCSLRSPPPAPAKRPPCAPSRSRGPKTAARCSASPRPRPRPLFLASRPASAPTRSPNSPGP